MLAVLILSLWAIVFSYIYIYIYILEIEDEKFIDADYIVSKQILSLKDSNDISGEFYIGRGTLENVKSPHPLTVFSNDIYLSPVANKKA